MRRLLLACVLAGCGTRPPPPPRDLGTLAPARTPVARYGDPVEAPAAGAALREALATEAHRVADEHRRPRPEPSPALSAVAEALAEAGQGETPDAAAVDFAAGHFGVVAPVPSVVVMKGRGSTEDFVRELTPVLAQVIRRGRYNRLGVGVAPVEAGEAVVVLLQEEAVALAPVPRHLPVGATAPLRGRILGYGEVQVLATGADGQVRTLQRGEATIDTAFACEAAGRHRVEVMGTGRLGPLVLANFSVYCGDPPPERLALRAGVVSEVPAEAAERALLALINEARARQQQPPLRWDDRLAAVARAHSEDMRKHGFVGHISPTTGSPGDRVRAARLVAGAVEENVGVGPSPEAVHAGLMESPAHRAAILSATATRVGIGVVRRPRQGVADYFATQLMTTPPAPVDVAEARRVLEGGLAGRRADAGLAAVAQSLAEDLARGTLAADRTQAATRSRLEARKVPLEKLAAVAGVGGDAGRMLADPVLARAELHRYGVGVAAGEQGGYPVLFMVVLVGR